MFNSVAMHTDCLTQLFIELTLHYIVFQTIVLMTILSWVLHRVVNRFSTFRRNECLLHRVKTPRRHVLFSIYCYHKRVR